MATTQWQTKCSIPIEEITVTSPIVIIVLNKELLATEHETKSSFVAMSGNLNNKSTTVFDNTTQNKNARLECSCS